MESAVCSALSDNHGLTDECQKLTNKIRGALYDIAHSFVYIGFLLAECESCETYKEWGYSSIHEYAFDQFGFKKSSTYNFINVCKAFSSNSSTDKKCSLPFSMNMKDNYKDFNYSQLVEMLSMNDKQRSQVTPDMTVKQIREVKRSSEEPEYTKLYYMQLNFQEFKEVYHRKINGKKFTLKIEGCKCEPSDIWPDGYFVSLQADLYMDCGHGSGYNRIVDYKEFVDLILHYWNLYIESDDSRRLESVPEETSAPEVPEEPEPEFVSYPGYDLLIVPRGDLHTLFNSIEDAYLDIDKNIDSDLFEMVFGFFKIK